jgi:TatD DNase family protein
LLIDSHIHLDNDRYAEDRRAVLERAWAEGVGLLLSIGIGEEAMAMDGALKLCREFSGAKGERLQGLPKLFASAGVYPHNTHEIDATLLAKLDHLLAQPEVIACGEIGIDYYHDGAPRETQLAGLKQQLEIAAKHKRPILIHCRAKGDDPVANTEAWEDLFATLESDWRPSNLGGIMHCFSGSLAQAQRSIDLGFLISFAGNLTYPKAEQLREVAARLPLESLLVETDAPWLAPAPERGKRNEPAFVTRTAATLAAVRGVTAEVIAEETTKNFLRLFRLPPEVGN